MLLSVSKWRKILRGKTKSAPKTIFSGNGNGLKNFTLSTREQKNVHTVYVKQYCAHMMCVFGEYIQGFKEKNALCAMYMYMYMYMYM